MSTHDKDAESNLLPLKTSRFITKYELARVIGMRILQLKDSHMEIQANTTIEKYVIDELKEKKNPCVIRRYLPNGKYEDCAVRNLEFDEESKFFVLAETRFIDD